MSQPCKRLKLSTPELRAQLNLTNDHKKKERPHLKHVLLPDFSWKKRWSQAQRHVVQPNDIRQGENRKMTSCSLYLNELLIQKCKFRHRVVASTLCLDKHSPKGSCHLDESSMNHTLAQNNLCEFWCGMHLTCKNTPLNLTGKVWRQDQRRISKFVFPRPC